MQAHTVFDALQLAIGPVILISACGLLLLSMTNRLGRAIDRARLLAKESHKTKAIQISILLRRARLIRSAILCASICISLTVLLVLTLFCSVLMPFDVKMAITTLFTLGQLSLIASLAFFISDIFSSLRAMEIEVQGGESTAVTS